MLTAYLIGCVITLLGILLYVFFQVKSVITNGDDYEVTLEEALIIILIIAASFVGFIVAGLLYLIDRGYIKQDVKLFTIKGAKK